MVGGGCVGQELIGPTMVVKLNVETLDKGNIGIADLRNNGPTK